MKIGRKPPKFPSVVRVLQPPACPGSASPLVLSVSVSGTGMVLPFPTAAAGAKAGARVPVARLGERPRPRRPPSSPPLYHQLQQEGGHNGQDPARPVSAAACLLVHERLLVRHDVRGQLGLRARGEQGFIRLLLGGNHPNWENTYFCPLGSETSGPCHGACLAYPSRAICSPPKP